MAGSVKLALIETAKTTIKQLESKIESSREEMKSDLSEALTAAVRALISFFALSSALNSHAAVLYCLRRRRLS
jgi:hypothetical protein